MSMNGVRVSGVNVSGMSASCVSDAHAQAPLFCLE